MNYDYLAWVIIVLGYLWVVVPIMGTAFAIGTQTYSEAWKAGAALNLFLLAFASVVGGILWALYHLGIW